MTLLKVILLAIVQGLAELLPVSSSAHVIVAEKLMGLDPSSPAMTLLLVMLHTGTMFAVIVYFWKQWVKTYFASADAFKRFAIRVIWATILTGVIGEVIKKIIEKTLFHGAPKAELEQLFGRLDLIAPALAAAGVIILIAGLRERNQKAAASSSTSLLSTAGTSVTMKQAGWMGAVQGLALPFRGFSRSGSTISAGMLVGAKKGPAETFSFALAVVLTPAVVGMEALRLLKASHEAAATGAAIDLKASLVSSLLGMVFSFLAGLVALKWLSSWLETGKWWLFGIYCLVASGVVYYLFTAGY
ncbi:undecaprenyl-diphosphate phosphatase [Granulicella sp. WH15]|uniref:undecaprenyl-diphosphate phosphatase n=1 Tax=Granulicella sp. WH15 TaxID=2602070 RepID=UPI0013677428|nr:undecaprenyl-diphosphate phosphatase [Granulicella sp. WH15]QHN02507.1 undecaprenyl-diphosphate phosphatase [Granulicella sp. WH15]